MIVFSPHKKSGCFSKGYFCTSSLVCGVHKNKPLKSHWSVLHSLAVLVDCKSHWSLKPDGLGAHLSRVPPKSWGKNLFLGKSSGFVSFLLIMGCCRRGKVCNEIGSQLFLPASMWFLSHLPDVKGLVTSPDFPVFRRNFSVCRFDVSVGGHWFRFTLCHCPESESIQIY